MNIHRDDSFSTREYGTDRVNQIRPIEKILEETTFYNEILLYQKTKDTEGDLGPNRKFIRPSYLIALNNISKETIELAKLHNLPVLLIQEDYYINLALDSILYTLCLKQQKVISKLKKN